MRPEKEKICVLQVATLTDSRRLVALTVLLVFWLLYRSVLPYSNLIAFSQVVSLFQRRWWHFGNNSHALYSAIFDMAVWNGKMITINNKTQKIGKFQFRLTFELNWGFNLCTGNSKSNLFRKSFSRDTFWTSAQASSRHSCMYKFKWKRYMNQN